MKNWLRRLIRSAVLTYYYTLRSLTYSILALFKVDLRLHTVNNIKKKYLGIIAEYICIVIYKIKFYQILHHRKRYYVGEIDIIALRNKEIVFIEVKARSSNIDDRFVSFNQQKRIKRAAEMFLSSSSKYNNYNIRFDLVIVSPYKFL
ncbi:YraN family protein [Rickettsia sp. MEAM1 (Bemisia tabaci)]|uniref:YraN family protein n=1 Tax=Rickettsia sp. MEAM1 (Bemisia tabaci) TaxID=1182263 RepID=UPI001E35567A|nr:YraN family protein [Rickettsia sp. MEAM1 (Bemisia tabaci)]